MPAPSKREKSMSPIAWRCVLSALLAVVGLASACSAWAADPAAEARQAWQLLLCVLRRLPMRTLWLSTTHLALFFAVPALVGDLARAPF